MAITEYSTFRTCKYCATVTESEMSEMMRMMMGMMKTSNVGSMAVREEEEKGRTKRKCKRNG